MRTLLVAGDDGGDDDNSDSDADDDSNDEGDDDDDVEVGGDGDGKRRRKTVYRPVDTRKTPCLSRESSFLAKHVDTKLLLTRSFSLPFFLFFFRFFLLLPSHLFLSLSFFPTKRRSSKHAPPLLPPQNCNSRYDRILTSSTTCREKRSRSSRATATFLLPFPFSSTIYLSIYRTIDRSVVRSA